jgi:hypothetical protein
MQQEFDQDEIKEIPIELSEITILSSSKRSLRKYSASNISALSAAKSHYSEIDKDILTGTNLKLLTKEEITYDNINAKLRELDNDKKKTSFQLKQFKGFGMAMLASLTGSLSHILVKKSKWLCASDHACIRYLLTFLTLFIYMKYKKIEFFPHKSLNLLILRGLIGNYIIELTELN